MGPASSRSSALPWGMPSTTSTSTTSPSSFSTTYWATLAPTLPAPTAVIFARAVIRFSSRLQGRHVLDDLAAELRALHFLGAFHEAGEVVGPGQDLLQEGVGDGVLDEDLAGRRLAVALLPRHRLVAELALGQRVAPLHEHAFGVLLNVALVHERHVAPVVLDGIADGGADQPLRPLLRYRLDADGGRVREADLVDLHLALEELDDLLGLGRPLLPLDAGVDVLGVLPEDHHVDLVRPFHRRRHALEVLHRAQADVEVEHLAERDVQRAEAFTDGGGERALERDQILADVVERLLGQQVGRAVGAVDCVRLLAGVHLHPRDLLLAARGLRHRGVEHADGSAPDVGPGPVTFDERDDGMIGHSQLAVLDGDLVARGDLDPASH